MRVDSQWNNGKTIWRKTESTVGRELFLLILNSSNKKCSNKRNNLVSNLSMRKSLMPLRKTF